MPTGRQTVAPGQTIASQWGNLVWDQSMQDFASAADRTTQFPSPKPGNPTWLEDTKTLQVWDGTRWVTIMASVPGSGGVATIQAVSAVVTTNASGGFNYNYTTAFPAGYLPRVVACDGDANASMVYDVGIINSQSTNTGTGGIVYRHNSTAAASVTIRINIIAV